MRVLVIDDNEDTAFLMARLTSMCGHESRFCTLPRQAIEFVHKWRPEVILVDLAMPEMDGYTLAPKLREASDGIVPRILLASGHVPDEEREASATIDGHLVKPVGLQQLRDLLPC
jgi:CheY-like chemotaxis protein